MSSNKYITFIDVLLHFIFAEIGAMWLIGQSFKKIKYHWSKRQRYIVLIWVRRVSGVPQLIIVLLIIRSGFPRNVISLKTSVFAQDAD